MIEKLENFIEPIREITYKSEVLLDNVKRNALKEFYTYMDKCDKSQDKIGQSKLSIIDEDNYTETFYTENGIFEKRVQTLSYRPIPSIISYKGFITKEDTNGENSEIFVSISCPQYKFKRGGFKGYVIESDGIQRVNQAKLSKDSNFPDLHELMEEKYLELKKEFSKENQEIEFEK